MQTFSFHALPPNSPSLGFFSNGDFRLDLSAAPFLAIEQRTQLRFALSPPLPNDPVSLMENCYGILRPGRTLELRVKARGGGCCCGTGRATVHVLSVVPISETEVHAPNQSKVAHKDQNHSSNVEASRVPRKPPSPTPEQLIEQMFASIRSSLESSCHNLNLEIECMEGGKRHSLSDAVSEFLSKRRKSSLLVLGESGCGKTLFCREYARKLADSRTAVPIYIDLRRFEDLPTAVSDTLQSLKVQPTPRFSQLPFLFIFDSFDQRFTSQNVLDTTKVLETYPQSAMMVMADASISNLPRYKNCFARPGEPLLASVTELVICPFTSEQLLSACRPDREDIIATIKSGAVRNPLLLSLSLSEGTVDSGLLEGQLITEVMLSKTVAGRSREKMKDWLIDIAFDRLNLTNISDEGKNELVTSGLLTYRKNKLVFAVSDLQSAFQALGFHKDYEKSTYDYFRLLLANDSAVFRFFRDISKGDVGGVSMREFLTNVICKSANEIVAANAISLSVACQIPLSHSDFSRVNFHKADLRGGLFRNINFENANFEGVRMAETLFLDCKISKSQIAQGIHRSICMKTEEQPVFLIASPDGSRLAFSQQCEVVVVNSKDFELLGRLKGHEGQVSSASFSQDGTSLVSADLDDSIRWWSLDSTSEQYRQHLPPGHLPYLSVSLEDVVAVAGTPITLWSSGASWTTETLGGELKSAALLISFSKTDADKLVSAHKDKQLRIWSITSGELITSVACESAVRDMTYSNGVVSLCTASVVFRWAGDSLQTTAEITPKADCCRFDRSQRFLACGWADQPGGAILDTEAHRTALTFPQVAVSLCFADDSLILVDAEEITKIDLASKPPLRKPAANRIQGVFLSTEKGLVATVHEGKRSVVRNLVNGEIVASIPFAAAQMYFLNDSIAIITVDGVFMRFSASNYNLPIETIREVTQYVYTTGSLYAVYYRSGLLQVHHSALNYKLPPSERFDSFTALRLRKDKLIGVRAKGTVVSWRFPETDLKPFAFTVRNSPACFSANENLLVVVNKENRLEVVDTEQEKPIGTMEISDASNLEIQFLDDSHIAAASFRRSFSVYNVRSYALIAAIALAGCRHWAVGGNWLVMGDEALEAMDLTAASGKSGGLAWERGLRTVWARNFVCETKAISVADSD